MTTSVTQTEWPYVGNSSTKTFAFNFSITSLDDINVYLALDGALASSLVSPSEYTVEYDEATQGGTITYPIDIEGEPESTPITSNDKIAIQRKTIVKQGTDLKNQSSLMGDNVEFSDDNLSRQIQDAVNEAKRAIKVDVTSTDTADELLQAINDAAISAEESATNAGVSEANAALSELNAATSETNAGISATNAGISETNAATSETNAGVSEANAQSAESLAAVSAADAIAAKNAAEISETNSAESEVNAVAAAASAEASEINAGISETNAAQSALDASIVAQGLKNHIDGGILSTRYNAQKQYTPYESPLYTKEDYSYGCNGTSEGLIFSLGTTSLANNDFNFEFEVSFNEMGQIEGLAGLQSSTEECFLIMKNAANQLNVWLSSNGSTWTIADNVLGTKTDWEINTRYKIRTTFDGNFWKVDWSTDGDVWTNDISIETTLQLRNPTSRTFYIGIRDFSPYYWLDGKIYTTGCSMTVGGIEILKAQPDNKYYSTIDMTALESRDEDDSLNIGAPAKELDILNPDDYEDGTIKAPTKDQFPAMTSDSAPVGEFAWCTTRYSASYPAWYACDKRDSADAYSWISQNGITVGTLLRKMSVVFPIDTIAYQPRIGTSSGYHAKDFTVVYTKDDMSEYSVADPNISNINFTTVLTVTGNVQANTELKEFVLDSPIPSDATAWGIIVTDSSSSGAGTYLTCQRLEGYSTTNNDQAGYCVWAVSDKVNGDYMTLSDYTGSTIIGKKKRFVRDFRTKDNGEIISKVSYGQGKQVMDIYDEYLIEAYTYALPSTLEVTVPKGNVRFPIMTVNFYETGGETSRLYLDGRRVAETVPRATSDDRTETTTIVDWVETKTASWDTSGSVNGNARGTDFAQIRLQGYKYER